MPGVRKGALKDSGLSQEQRPIGQKSGTLRRQDLREEEADDRERLA